MKPFYDLNRLLCRCLEVLNILMALPLGALIYVAAVDYLTRIIPRTDTPTTFLDLDIIINLVSVALAIIGILYINGGIAQALDKRRFLEHISQSVEDIDHAEKESAKHPANNNTVTIIEDGVAKPHQSKKERTAKASKKAAKKATAAVKTKKAAKKTTGKKAAAKKK